MPQSRGTGKAHASPGSRGSSTTSRPASHEDTTLASSPGWLKFRRVRRAEDDDDRHVLRRRPGHLEDACWGRHQWVAAPEHCEGRHGGVEEPLEGREERQPVEEPQPAQGPEPDVVGHRHPCHPRRLAQTVASELRERSGQRLVVHSTCRRDEHESVDALGCGVRHLEADRAAHRVAQENRLRDLQGVEEVDDRPPERRQVERPAAKAAASVAREVGHDVDPGTGETLRRRHEVGARDGEPVDVEDGHDIGRATAAADEDVAPAGHDGLLRPPTDVGHAADPCTPGGLSPDQRRAQLPCPSTRQAPTSRTSSSSSLNWVRYSSA